MKAEDLRASILQAAVQGKLVSQDPNDEPASVLVERIREEKKRLIKEKNIKADKNESHIFRRDGHWYETINGKNETCIDDEIPFDIPKNWIWSRLESIVSKTIRRGKTPKYVQKSNTLVFAQKCNVKNGGIDLYLSKYLDESKLSKLLPEDYLLDGDIVINSTGNGTLGRVGFYHDFDNPRGLNIVPDTHVTTIRSSKLMEGSYLYYYLKKLQPYLETLGEGSTNQTELSPEVIKKVLIAIPPQFEQKRIVQKIEELMPIIEKYGESERELTQLIESFPTDLKASILQAAVQGKLVSQDPNDEPASVLVERIREEKKRLIKEKKIKADKDESYIYRRDSHWYETINGKNEVCIDGEIPFEVPDSWSWQRGKTCFKKMESTKPSGEYFDYIDIDAIDNKKCIVSSPKRIVSTKAPSRATRALHEGDVLFSTVRPYLRNIAIVDSFLKDCIASTGFYVCSPVEFFDSKYLYWLLISNYVIDGLMVFMKGDNSPSINNSDIENYLFPIPPISEQKRIVQKIEELSKQIDSLILFKNQNNEEKV